jgi:hypothetical protein
MGHNFGMIHDCVSGCSITGTSATNNGGAICCPLSATSCNTGADYIMSPVASQATQVFSPCSIGNICSLLSGGLNTTCINDPTRNPRETLSLEQCGNGILEPGEECDAGPNGSQCCSSSCRLTSGSVCDPETSDCCTDSCQYASASTVCRPAVDSRCDTAETCTGNNSTCPVDVRKADGDSCASDGLTCASGHCTSRDLQCQEQSASGMSFTRACPLNAANSCSISCRNPSSSSSCLILQSQFIDGTECGNGGTCLAGECQSHGWQNTFKGWYRENLNIAIPVTIIVAILILAILYCIGRSCYRRAQQGKSRKATSSNVYYPPPSGPPPMRQSENSHWVEPHSFNGQNGYPSYR